MVLIKKLTDYSSIRFFFFLASMSSFLTFGHAGESMASLELLLFLGYFATAQAATALDCTNDYETIFCQLDVKPCSQFTLDIQDTLGYGKYSCSLGECNSKCCCSVSFSPIVGEKYHIKAFRGVAEVNSTTIDVLKSLKAKTPTIDSVNDFEGIFTVRWKSNMGEIIEKYLKFEVTISKRDKKKVSKLVVPTIANGLLSYQISNDLLEPGTEYTVSVRSYFEDSQKFSDRSNELAFKTPIQQSSVFMWIVIGLSMFGVIMCIPIYKCYTKLRKKLKNNYSPPKSFGLQVKKPEFYKPKPVATCYVKVETLNPSNDDEMQKKLDVESKARMNQNSSRDSSDPCYGQTEPMNFRDIIRQACRNALSDILPKLSFPELPVVPENKNVFGLSSNETSSASSGISNRSYFMSDISPPDQAMEENSAEELQKNLCNITNSNTAITTHQQVLAFLLSCQKQCSPFIQIDPSYKSCKAALQRSSYTENTSLCSSSSSNITPPSSISSGEPSGSHSCEDNYKPFPNRVEQTNVLNSEEFSSEHHQCLNVNQDETFIKIPQFHFSPVKGQSPSVLQIPHFIMSSDASCPVMVRSDYKFV